MENINLIVTMMGITNLANVMRTIVGVLIVLIKLLKDQRRKHGLLLAVSLQFIAPTTISLSANGAPRIC